MTSPSNNSPQETKPNMVPVAIVGMACRLPGADTIEQFWSNLRQGISSLGTAPADRFDRENYYDPEVGKLNRSYTDLAGVIDYPPVDRTVCPVTDEMLKRYDKAHLNLCETASRACLHAGMDPFHFPVRNTGVYIGNTRSGSLGSEMVIAANIPETIRLLQTISPFREGDAEATWCEQMMDEVVQDIRSRVVQRRFDGSPSTGASSAAILISQALQTNGPCIVFNSACASSLQALCQAVQALQLGHIDMAIAGGASYFHQDTLVLFSHARSLTAHRSCPFDQDADGLIVGEGAVVLLLKRLDQAIADGNKIYSVIRGIGIASDGKGKSLWAPRKEGQIEAMRRAYSDQCPPSSVGYVEAHATSTALGDATEMGAIAEFFGDAFGKRKIPVGSSKGNVGHTLEVAGLTGLLKAVLSIDRRMITPVAGLKTLNPKIAWEQIPFFAPMTELPWETEGNTPRVAAVNSFGIGGLNVHVVLEEYVPVPSPTRISSLVPLPKVEQSIAVVGLGAILPGALTAKDYYQNLMERKSALRRVPLSKFDESILKNYVFPNRSDIPEFYGGFIENYQYDWRKNKIPPKQIENASPLQFMILDAVNEAFETGGFALGQIDRKPIGVVVGTSFGSDFSVQLGITLFLPKLASILRQRMQEHGIDKTLIESILEQYSAALIKKMPALTDETGSFTTSALASRITKTFDLMGGAVAIDAESASSFAALQCCIDQLRSGMNEMMICIAGQQDLGGGIYESLVKTEAITEPPVMSPFDVSAGGSLPGEGCAALLLKRYDQALRDGNTIFGIIRGIGVAAGDDRLSACREALRRSAAAMDCKNVEEKIPDFVEMATTEKMEYNVHLVDALMEEFLGTSKQKICLGAVSNQIGNLVAASGAASLLKALFGLRNRAYPANVHIDRIAPYIKRHQELLEVPAESTSWQDSRPRTAFINAGQYSFYNVILQDHREGAEPQSQSVDNFS
ncbi:MAG: polyketide synthase [Planctomycetaceae bacterium]|jgi:acyl transferase domain-containing protein|nr:polyketide synthase [Planctomycetaceae bacterium]